MAVIAAGNPFAAPGGPEPWLKPELIDPNKPDTPDNVRLHSKVQPVVEKDGAIWTIIFRAP